MERTAKSTALTVPARRWEWTVWLQRLASAHVPRPLGSAAQEAGVTAADVFVGGMRYVALAPWRPQRQYNMYPWPIEPLILEIRCRDLAGIVENFAKR